MGPSVKPLVWSCLPPPSPQPPRPLPPPHPCVSPGAQPGACLMCRWSGLCSKLFAASHRSQVSLEPALVSEAGLTAWLSPDVPPPFRAPVSFCSSKCSGFLTCPSHQPVPLGSLPFGPGHFLSHLLRRPQALARLTLLLCPLQHPAEHAAVMSPATPSPLPRQEAPG